MKPSIVTLTGADNSVHPGALIEISKRYPWVEWGILIGLATTSANGRTRFPSFKWIEQLANLTASEQFGVNLSLHICGHWLENLIEGGGDDLARGFGPLLTRFDRCQLNFHGERQKEAAGQAIGNSFKRLRGREHWMPEVIFQLDGVNDALQVESGLPKVSGLFDMSHGAGVLPKEWPSADDFQLCYTFAGGLGYAGGLGPENLAEQLPLIEKAAGSNSWWCDMESRLYTSTDRGMVFDLEKCVKVLEIVKNWP